MKGFILYIVMQFNPKDKYINKFVEQSRFPNSFSAADSKINTLEKSSTEYESKICDTLYSTQTHFSLKLTCSEEELLNYFDKIHPVVSMMTSSPSLRARPTYTHTHTLTLSHTQQHVHTVTRKKIIYLCGSLHERHLWVKQGLLGLCSGQGSAFCVRHLQSKCT